MGDKNYWKSLSVSCNSMKAQLGEIMEIAKSIQETLKELERKKKEEAMLAMETFAAVHEEAPVQTNAIVEKVHEKNMEEPRKDHVTINLKSDMSLKVISEQENLNHKENNDMVGRGIHEVMKFYKEKEISITCGKIHESCHMHMKSWSLRASSESKRDVMINDYG
ncbi:Uncharacterized protein Rs2_52609 [Raphanus sativus]|nr:Uncharacterized protein Rs2_52609 [Raphanus sativus]